MLSYRHAFHAGNHADVLKHLVLVQILKHLNRKEKPWWYVDTHAGAGLYALDSDFALKNAEFQTGIGRLWEAQDLPEVVGDYVEQVRSLNPDGQARLYPGSPWLARQMMRKQDQLRLFELHSTDVSILRQTLDSADRRVKIETTDGFSGLKAVLPPQPRRGLVLIDPPYELRQDYRQVPNALREGLQRFASGIYIVWYPLLKRAETRQLPDRLKRLPISDWLHVSLSVCTPADLGLYGSGLFILNPPWGLAESLRHAMPFLARTLGQDAEAGFTLEQQQG